MWLTITRTFTLVLLILPYLDSITYISFLQPLGKSCISAQPCSTTYVQVRICARRSCRHTRANEHHFATCLATISNLHLWMLLERLSSTATRTTRFEEALDGARETRTRSMLVNQLSPTEIVLTIRVRHTRLFPRGRLLFDIFLGRQNTWYFIWYRGESEQLLYY